jgi:pimeloyl-ACP methyl ester carboxylesterase
MKNPGKTPPFRTPSGEIIPRSIAEVRYLNLGRADQWVMMRGESLDNPPLILLHGGPGFSETHFFRRFNTKLERSFTVVYWDQRGSGKSFDHKSPASSLTVNQLVADLDELVETVFRRVGHEKVAIFGHSWGSALGILYAARFPNKVAAYIGSGQLGDWAAAESASYAYALSEAQRRGNPKALKELLAIGPPPYPASSLWTERTWLQRFEGHLKASALWNMAREFLSQPELSIFDLVNLMRGFRSSFFAMWPEVSKLNLIEAAPELKMPVFFLLGRHDHWVPPETSVAYLDALSAPMKRLIWFEESGHEPFVDEPSKFNAALLEIVRPVVLSEEAAGDNLASRVRSG